MWGWQPTWWQIILIFIGILISTIACFPCFVLQKLGFKMKRTARFLSKSGLEDLSFFIIQTHKD